MWLLSERFSHKDRYQKTFHNPYQRDLKPFHYCQIVLNDSMFPRSTSKLTPKRSLISVIIVRNVLYKKAISKDTLDTKEKNQCEYIVRNVLDYNILKAHIKTHSKEKPYRCDYCQKCFVQKGNFKRHIRTHTKEKPYQCEYCQKCFGQRLISKDTLEFIPKRNLISVSIVGIFLDTMAVSKSTSSEFIPKKNLTCVSIVQNVL